MSDKHFVDTNILLYARDRFAGPKYERAHALLERLWIDRSGILSTQVLQEFCVNVRRKSERPLSIEETRAIVADYSRWTVVVNTAASVLEALDLEKRYKVSFCEEPVSTLLGRAPRCGPHTISQAASGSTLA